MATVVTYDGRFRRVSSYCGHVHQRKFGVLLLVDARLCEPIVANFKHSAPVRATTGKGGKSHQVDSGHRVGL